MMKHLKNTLISTMNDVFPKWEYSEILEQNYKSSSHAIVSELQETNNSNKYLFPCIMYVPNSIEIREVPL